MTIDQHIRELRKVMSDGVYEKDHIMAMSLLSAVAGESIFLLGPPGTAKSMVARRLKMIFKDGQAFEYLMSRFSTPDEIFGPVSISQLKNEDRYERVVDGFLPTATVVFLDEIWKAGPSIQNALLTAINERIFQNGRTTLQLPLKALIAASNELPAENEGLEALWDRFLVRMVSNCIQDERTFYQMIRQRGDNTQMVPEYLLITDEIYDKWQRKIMEIDIPDEICKMVSNVRMLLKKEMNRDNVVEMDYYISDRRWKKCFHLLQTSAFLNGRNSIDPSDFLILIHCLWNKTETIPSIINMVCSSLTAPLDAKISKCRKAIDTALKSRNSNSQYDEECGFVVSHFFYYNILGYSEGKTLFYKMDYNHLSGQEACDGIAYYDEEKRAQVIRIINVGSMYDGNSSYNMQNLVDIKRVRLSKCIDGVVINDKSYAFQKIPRNRNTSSLSQNNSNIASNILGEIRNKLFVEFSDLKKLFTDYRNPFLSDDDIRLAKKYLAECEKRIKELEVKARNASLLL